MFLLIRKKTEGGTEKKRNFEKKEKEIKRGEKSRTTYNKRKIGDGREKNQGCQIEFLSS